MKILIADDEKGFEALIRPFFKRQGLMDVVFVNNPVEAIEKIKLLKPDVVLLDINFEEDLDGFEVLRQTKTECSGTKFIMSSAYPECAEKALASGANGFLAKPVRLAVIIEKIKEMSEGIKTEC